MDQAVTPSHTTFMDLTDEGLGVVRKVAAAPTPIPLVPSRLYAPVACTRSLPFTPLELELTSGIVRRVDVKIDRESEVTSVRRGVVNSLGIALLCLGLSVVASAWGWHLLSAAAVAPMTWFAVQAVRGALRGQHPTGQDQPMASERARDQP